VKRLPFLWFYFIALVILLLAILAGPIFPVPLAVIIDLILYIVLRATDKVEPFKGKDLIPMIFLTIIVLFIGSFLAFGTALAVAPFWKILLIGIIADAVSYLTGLVDWAFPVGLLISILAGLFIWIVSVLLVGGVVGSILGALALIIIALPGPIPLVTVSFVVLKLLITFFGTALTSLV